VSSEMVRLRAGAANLKTGQREHYVEEFMLKTRITEQYGLKVPFINAGMAFIATVPLVRAVCSAGGMGDIRVRCVEGHRLPGIEFQRPGLRKLCGQNCGRLRAQPSIVNPPRVTITCSPGQISEPGPKWRSSNQHVTLHARKTSLTRSSLVRARPSSPNVRKTAH
jgi:hypothetical protein